MERHLFLLCLTLSLCACAGVASEVASESASEAIGTSKCQKCEGFFYRSEVPLPECTQAVTDPTFIANIYYAWRQQKLGMLGLGSPADFVTIESSRAESIYSFEYTGSSVALKPSASQGKFLPSVYVRPYLNLTLGRYKDPQSYWELMKSPSEGGARLDDRRAQMIALALTRSDQSLYRQHLILGKATTGSFLANPNLLRQALDEALMSVTQSIAFELGEASMFTDAWNAWHQRIASDEMFKDRLAHFLLEVEQAYCHASPQAVLLYPKQIQADITELGSICVRWTSEHAY